MALIGYARVSVLEEETWHQHDHLEAAGCTRIFTDRASGVHEERPELARCFDHLREGDVLVVWRLERLGRSLRDLVDTVTALGERGIGLRSLDTSLDTTGPHAPVVLELCAALSEFELDIVRERTALAAAGIREPRRAAIMEAARSVPSRLVSAQAAEATQDDPPAALATSTPSSSEPVASATPRRTRPKPVAPDTPRRTRLKRVASATPRRSRPETVAPAAEPPPAGAARPPRTAVRRRALIAVQIGLSLAAAGAAFHVARSDADTSRTVLAHTAVNRDVQLRFPDGWRRTSADLSVAALALDDPIVLTLGRSGGSMLMAGMSPATGATLLTPALRRRLDSPAQSVRVRLGAHVAERYADLRPRESTRRMTVFVVPTTAGALTLACLAKPQDVAAVRDVCDRVAQSMRPRRGQALPAGPSTRYQNDLNELLGTLDATRADRRTKLASASTSTQQSRLAAELSRAYGAARAAASGQRVAPREAAAHRRIIVAIDEARAAYEHLGAAAGSASVTRYDRARKAVTHAERRIRVALAALAPLGYAPPAGHPSSGS